MAKKKAKKNKKRNLILMALLLVVSIFIGLYIFVQNSRAMLNTESVLIGTAENKIAVNGYIIRDEFVVKSPDTGMISYRADEGKRIAKDSTIAVVFKGEVSEDVKSELSSIHERINELEGSTVEKNLYAGDLVVGTSQVVNNIDAIANAVYLRDTTKVPQYKDDITRLVRKNNGEGEIAKTTLEQLLARKQELESSISGTTTGVYAARAGILCSKLDGYEDYFNVSCIENITPEYIKNTPKSSTKNPETVTKDEPCMKIVDNYEWYFAANVDEKWAEEIKAGAEISLRFTDISEDKLDGVVHSISEPKDGVCAIVIKSGSIFNGMYTTRNLKAEIVRRTYRGFKVSKEAVHIDADGTYYVFINSEGIVRKRNINILYSDDNYVIIEQNNSATNNLLLYDEVIVSGNNIKEGKTF